MAINFIKTDKYETGFVHDRREEFLMDDESEVAELPTDSVPGSIAYTADMTSAWQMSPNGTWVKISGMDWQQYIYR